MVLLLHPGLKCVLIKVDNRDPIQESPRFLKSGKKTQIGELDFCEISV